MKLIAILFLCSTLLTSLAQGDPQQETDCNDEDVLKAVDAALTKYNDGSKSGNQFVLYRITEGNKTEEQYVFYSVKYEIKEGNCSVQSGKTWRECDYKELGQAATGECTATIGKRLDIEFTVVTQTCHVTPAESPVVTSEYECLGCVNPITTVPHDLDPILRHAIQHFNKHNNHSHLFALKEVKKSQKQMVSGWNYEVTYLIEQTNCSKENFEILTLDCKALPDGDTGECTDLAYMDPQLRIASFSQKCELFSEDFLSLPKISCRGCPKEIPVDDPDVKRVLTHSITKLNAENNATFYFKIDIVYRATTQVVAGTRYEIDFTARETTCSKESKKELMESCEINKFGETLTCTADVYERLWDNIIEPTVKCQSSEKPWVFLNISSSPFTVVHIPWYNAPKTMKLQNNLERSDEIANVDTINFYGQHKTECRIINPF